jgi:hypothetical protein
MIKYLLPIIAAGAITSVSYAGPVALELWDFEDAAGLSLKSAPTEENPTPSGVANSGSNDSAWNYGGFNSGASTDGIGNFVVTGLSGPVYRQTVPVSSPPTTGKYRLTLDIASWNISAGQIAFEILDSANVRVAGYALSTTAANGTRLQALVRSTSSPYNGNQYFSVSLEESGTTPISAYIEFDLDNDTAEVVVDGNTLGSAVTDLDSLDLSSIKFNQNGQFVDTNVVKIASMGLYEVVDTTTDTDGDGIADYYETGTGIWVSVTNTGTDPAVADATVQGIDIALYNYIASLGSGSGSGGSAGPEGPQGPAGPAGPPGPAGADGLDSDAIQNLRSSAHIERSPGDATFNVNYSIESSSDLETWDEELNGMMSVDPTSSDKMFLRLSTN